MAEGNGSGRGGGRWRARNLRWLVYAVVATVAAFCFITSYSHIFDLGRLHAQAGTAARLLPLSIDGLIIAATLVLFMQADAGKQVGLARWLPRLTLWAAIVATVLANLAYGMPSGWLSGVLSSWPGAAFVAAVEIGVIAIRMAPKDLVKDPIQPAGPGKVPASIPEAAEVSMARTAEAGNPLSVNQLQQQWGLPRSAAKDLRRKYVPESIPAGANSPIAAAPGPQAPAGALNGHTPHAG